MSPHIAPAGDNRPRPIEAAFCRIKLLHDRFDQRCGLSVEEVAFSNPKCRNWIPAKEANALARATREVNYHGLTNEFRRRFPKGFRKSGAKRAYEYDEKLLKDFLLYCLLRSSNPGGRRGRHLNSW